MVVSLVVLALLLVSAPALAYDQSGDHVGCVYETTANFNQLRNGTVDFALEGKGTAYRYYYKGSNRHFTRSGYWGGGWWALGGIDPGLGAYITCG